MTLSELHQAAVRDAIPNQTRGENAWFRWWYRAQLRKASNRAKSQSQQEG